MIDIDKAMLDPTEVFAQPEDVVRNKELNTEQKIQILRQWEYDEQEMSIAEEENMAGENGSDVIDRIHQLLIMLEASQQH